MRAKTADLPDSRERLAAGAILNLNTISTRDENLPLLFPIVDPSSREVAAEKILDDLESHPPLSNDGALARIRLGQDRIALAKLKPFFIVRTPGEFFAQYVLWCLIYTAAFWAVHLVWRWRRFRGDPAILPALHLLTGIGLILALSLRDPLRDTLEFSKFAWGCARLPVAAAAAAASVPLSKFSRVDLHAAAGQLRPVRAAAGPGSGPTGSDSKVNLGPFQPVEVIKILLVLFLAGYFRTKWEWLRDLRSKPCSRWLNRIPRFGRRCLPVICGVGCALAMFFLLKDMGPALVTGFLFLVMFAVARGQGGLALLGVAPWWAASRSAITTAYPTLSSTASRCGFRPGTTMCAEAISWRIRSGRSRPAASGDPAPAGAIRP